MLPHFGQAWISPIASALRTFSRERHVSQMTRKASTVDQTMVGDRQALAAASGTPARLTASYSQRRGGIIAFSIIPCYGHAPVLRLFQLETRPADRPCDPSPWRVS